MRSILITGGSGFFGFAFVKHLLDIDRGPQRIVVLSRGEHRQAEMMKEIEAHQSTVAHRMRWFIGDVRDRDRLRRAMEGIDLVVHAAALKRIEVGFQNPMETKKTNIDGAANVIEAAMDAGVDRVVALSTDKAFQPVSPYGTSKAFAESLFVSANNTRGSHGPRFSVCRYGNIWRSSGSVVPLWEEILSKSDTVPVTDPDCTRFFMTISEAVQLVMDTALFMKGGEINIPTLPAYRLGDLAEAMGAKMDVRGLPAWEKKAESMAEGNCSDQARRMSVAELKFALATK